MPGFAATFRALGAFIEFFTAPSAFSAFALLLSAFAAGVFSLPRLRAFLVGGAAERGGGTISIPNSAATSSSAKMRLLKAPVWERGSSAPADAINSALSTPRVNFGFNMRLTPLVNSTAYDHSVSTQFRFHLRRECQFFGFN